MSSPFPPVPVAVAAVKALRAIAYEARTANIIASLRMQTDLITAGQALDEETVNTINERLGFPTTESENE